MGPQETIAVTGFCWQAEVITAWCLRIRQDCLFSYYGPTSRELRQAGVPVLQLSYPILSYCLSIICLSIYLSHLSLSRVSLVAQLVKNPPAMQETWVQSLGWEDPLETGTATHSSLLVWRIP